MDIQHEDRRFFIEEDGEMKAEITYVPTGETKYIIDHTFVSDELRGQKIGQQLVDKVVELARSEQKKILPLCPFAKKVMEGDEHYNDVLV